MNSITGNGSMRATERLRNAAGALLLAWMLSACGFARLHPGGDVLVFDTDVELGDVVLAEIIYGMAGSGGNRSHWPRPPVRSSALGLAASQRPGASTASQSMADYVPAMSFLGQRTVVVGAAGSTADNRSAAGFVRRSDCSLTQYVLESKLSSRGPIIATLSGAQSYLRQLAELPALSTAFPAGCRDDLLGRAAQPVAFLGLTAAGDALGAAIDIHGNLVAGRASTAGVIQSYARLATRTAQHFSAADLNGDGIADLVVPWQDATASTAAGLAVYLSRPDGSFAPPTIYPVTGSRYYAFSAIEDVTGDGAPDIVMLGGVDLFTSTLSVLVGNGRGGFTAGPTRAGAGDVAAFVVADFDADGRKDVVSAAGSVLRGRGDGSFAPPVAAWNSVGSFGHLAHADFDRDGKLDLVLVTMPSGGFVTVMRGKGDGSFIEAASYAAALGATTVGVTDVDGDGNPDIVVGLVGAGIATSGPVGHTLTQFLLGVGDGSFVGARAWPSPSLAGAGPSARSAVVLADLDGDGIVDLLAPAPRGLTSAPPAGAGALVWQRGGSQGPGPPQVIAVRSAGAISVGVGDVDGDRQPDIVYATRDGLGVLRGSGSTGFGSEVSRALPAEPLVLRVADFDGDGRADIAVLSSDGLRVFRIVAGGAVGEPVLVESASDVITMDTADLNLDGRADLVLGRSNGSVDILLGLADGGFASTSPLQAGTGVQAVGIADIDGDGRQDIVVAADDASGGVSLQVFRGRAAGGFAAPVAKSLPESGDSRVHSLVLADFNGDGFVDAALARDNVTRVVVGMGDGRFDAEYAFAIAGHTRALNAGDIDGDGQPDLVSTVDLTGIATLLNRTRQWKQQSGGGGLSDIDRVMNWAESVYREYFPGPGIAGHYEGYQYRHYPQTGNFLAAKDARVIVHNGREWNLLDVGALADFLVLAAAAGF